MNCCVWPRFNRHTKKVLTKDHHLKGMKMLLIKLFMRTQQQDRAQAAAYQRDKLRDKHSQHCPLNCPIKAFFLLIGSRKGEKNIFTHNYCCSHIATDSHNERFNRQ